MLFLNSKKICRFTLFSILFVFLFNTKCIAQSNHNTKVFVTGDIINNSHLTSEFLCFVYPDDDYPQYCRGYINISPSIKPAKGRFMMPLVIGKTYYLDLTKPGGFGYKDSLLCSFMFKADSAHHVTIKFLSSNDSSNVQCSYSGDPNNDTAVITLIDKSKS